MRLYLCVTCQLCVNLLVITPELPYSARLTATLKPRIFFHKSYIHQLQQFTHHSMSMQCMSPQVTHYFTCYMFCQIILPPVYIVTFVTIERVWCSSSHQPHVRDSLYAAQQHQPPHRFNLRP